MNGGNKCVFSHHDSKSADVCAMFKKGLDFVIHNSEIYRNGHYIILDITIHTQRLTFVCLYGYNTDFFTIQYYIAKSIDLFKHKYFIMW